MWKQLANSKIVFFEVGVVFINGTVGLFGAALVTGLKQELCLRAGLRRYYRIRISCPGPALEKSAPTDWVAHLLCQPAQQE